MSDLFLRWHVAEGACDGKVVVMTKLQKEFAVRHLNLVPGFNAEGVRTSDVVFTRSLLADASIEVTLNTNFGPFADVLDMARSSFS